MTNKHNYTHTHLHTMQETTMQCSKQWVRQTYEQLTPEQRDAIQWRTLDQYQNERWFSHSAKGGIDAFIAEFCRHINQETGSTETSLVRLKKQADGCWVGANGEQLFHYLHNPQEVEFRCAWWIAHHNNGYALSPQLAHSEHNPFIK